MLIKCEYKKELENFLREIVDYTIVKYGKGLNFSNLRKIELKDISEFEIETDGRTVNDSTIILTSRLFDKLPNYNIESLENNQEFKTIIRTLFHELGHISDWTNYPNLYYYATNLDLCEETGIAAYFWIEYLAEKRSVVGVGNFNKDICDQFVKYNWQPVTINFDNPSRENFFFLNKALTYFLARTIIPDEREYYLNNINNQLLVDYIKEIWNEIIHLEEEIPFDDINKLSTLNNIMKKYYLEFKKENTNK